MKREEMVFISASIVAFSSLTLLNSLASPSYYENITMFVGLSQVLITGYLSFKTYSVGRRDSELPALEVAIESFELEDSNTKEENACDFEISITNRSYGRARIRNVDIRWIFSDANVKMENTDYPGPTYFEGASPPEILDMNEKLTLNLYVYSLEDLEHVDIKIDEADMGVMEYQLKDRELIHFVLSHESDKVQDLLESLGGSPPISRQRISRK